MVVVVADRICTVRGALFLDLLPFAHLGSRGPREL